MVESWDIKTLIDFEISAFSLFSSYAVSSDVARMVSSFFHHFAFTARARLRLRNSYLTSSQCVSIVVAATLLSHHIHSSSCVRYSAH